MGSDIIGETMKRTTQMATATFCFPMRRHLKSMFKQLRRRRLNEVIAPDTCFAKVKSIEGHWCSQVFCGCNSKTINIGVMKTESEFPHVHQDFLREHGIPHCWSANHGTTLNGHVSVFTRPLKVRLGLLKARKKTSLSSVGQSAQTSNKKRRTKKNQNAHSFSIV